MKCLVSLCMSQESYHFNSRMPLMVLSQCSWQCQVCFKWRRPVRLHLGCRHCADNATNTRSSGAYQRRWIQLRCFCCGQWYLNNFAVSPFNLLALQAHSTLKFVCGTYELILGNLFRFWTKPEMQYRHCMLAPFRLSPVPLMATWECMTSGWVNYELTSLAVGIINTISLSNIHWSDFQTPSHPLSLLTTARLLWSALWIQLCVSWISALGKCSINSNPIM
jgi:hypothetical protein